MTTKLAMAVLMTADEMTPRLFDLDFQLLADAVLSVIAVFVLFLAMSYFLFKPGEGISEKETGQNPERTGRGESQPGRSCRS